MEKLRLSQLSFVLKLTVWLTMLNSWLWFEDIVIEHGGLAPYLPFYRVQGFCVWDFTVTVLTSIVVFGAGRLPGLRGGNPQPH